ncbi:hypothetical protein [Kamptonema sp. UHCC 0994]|uniref:hypothetical protein n=1 Tax=Kamptonema sp. UHCC 0994 TaxID=3031329 RepID=UPI0023BA1025|nr:hypothetical protein [Kamptonema sp. UHCC 0994]
MSCPHDILGKPVCYIVEHPDRPQERFCTICKKRFVEQEYNTSIWLLIALVLIVLVVLLSACEKQTNSLKDGNSNWISTE